MFALFFPWSPDQPVADCGEAMQRSLSVGHTRPVGRARIGNILALSQTGAGGAKREPRGWRPALGPQREVVLFSGYLTNGDTLRRELGLGACDDAALYACAYARWGHATERRLIGQYAAVVADQARQDIHLATSGIRAAPVHYWMDDDRVVIASNARAIFATGLVAQEIDEQKIADTLYLNYRDGARDWFKGLRRVPPGHYARIRPGKDRQWRHYDVHALPDVRLASDAAYVEAANALFDEAVRAELQGFARPAVSLSGGFDSQGVAAFVAAAFPDRRLLGFTSVPQPGHVAPDLPGLFANERPHVEALAAMTPALDVRFIDSAGKSFDHHDRALFLLSGTAPRNPANMTWMHDVFAGAREAGCDVLLNGEMGNPGFSFDGLGALPGAFVRGRWGWLLAELREQARMDGRGIGRSFVSHVALQLLPDGLRHALRTLVGRAAPDPFDSWCALHRNYAAEMRVTERAHDFGYAKAPSFRSTRQPRAHICDNAMYEVGDLYQGMELLHGIPVRDPTAWRPFFEFCVGVPDDQYLRGGQKRWLAKRMLRGKVPDMVLDEQRRGHQAADWQGRIGAQREALRAELSRLGENPAMARRIDLESLKQLLDDYPQAAPTTIDDPMMMRVVSALVRAISTARFINFAEGRND